MIRTVTTSLETSLSVLCLGSDGLVLDESLTSAPSMSSSAFNQEEICLSNLGAIRSNPGQHLWNLRLPSADEMLRELEAVLELPESLSSSTSCKVVIHSSCPTSRDREPLSRLAARLEKKNIMVVTGVLPSDCQGSSTPETMATDLVHKLKFGVEVSSPGPTSGTLPELPGPTSALVPLKMDRIGMGFLGLVDLPALRGGISEEEGKRLEGVLLKAMGMASRLCQGVPIFLTTHDVWGQEAFSESRALSIIDGVHAGGAKHAPIVFCRCPCHVHLLRSYAAILKYDDQVHLSFSFHGNAFYASPTAALASEVASDEEGARLVSLLCEEGFASRILLSHTITCRLKLQKYGGFGYTHLPQHILPRLLRLGVSPSDLARVGGGNMRRLLAWWRPPPPVEKPVEIGTCSWCKAAFEVRENAYFSKFAYVYCTSRCLSAHGDTGWKALDDSERKPPG